MTSISSSRRGGHRDLYDDGVYTDFVGPDGWRSKAQTLWDAEQTHMEWGQEHNQTAWKRRGLLNIEEAYLDDQTPDADHNTNIEAWTVANAGAGIDGEHENVTSELGNEDAVFPGGFAGKCEPPTTWQYNDDIGEWGCSAGFNWRQLALLPETRGDFAAVIIPHTNFMEEGTLSSDLFFENYYESATEDDLDAGGEPEALVDVECWPGEVADYSTDTAISFDSEVSVQEAIDNKKPLAVYGELNYDNKYSCSWAYRTVGGSEYSELTHGTVVEMHESQGGVIQEVVDEHFDSIEGIKNRYRSMSRFESDTSDFVRAKMN